MFTSNVQSNTRPGALAYYILASGIAEVYLRENIHETENEEGPGYEYDEIYFQATESREDIEANIDAWREYGAEWESENALSQADIIAKLQAKAEQNRSDIDYIAAMADIELEG
ncbi:MAG: hypothetical protein PHV18_04210 [Lachnospiraceae bacterium]|nr:hypothetical protein [Lachnospiraceae bacterium]